MIFKFLSSEVFTQLVLDPMVPIPPSSTIILSRRIASISSCRVFSIPALKKVKMLVSKMRKNRCGEDCRLNYNNSQQGVNGAHRYVLTILKTLKNAAPNVLLRLQPNA